MSGGRGVSRRRPTSARRRRRQMRKGDGGPRGGDGVSAFDASDVEFVRPTVDRTAGGPARTGATGSPPALGGPTVRSNCAIVRGAWNAVVPRNGSTMGANP